MSDGMKFRPLLLLLMLMLTWTTEAAGDDSTFVKLSRLVSEIQHPWTKQPQKAGRVGDGCDQTEDCAQIVHSFCDLDRHVCTCPSHYPVDGGAGCGRVAGFNETCSFTAECTESDRNVECRDQRCQCRSGFKPTLYTGAHFVCTSTDNLGIGALADPTMIGVLVGLGLMFIIMCVVLRLFSKARWRENRTIFNTPNPRLANASLLKEVTINNANKTIPGSRRGSLRNGSRQASLASIPHTDHSGGRGNGDEAAGDDHHHGHLLAPPTQHPPPQLHHQSTNTTNTKNHRSSSNVEVEHAASIV